MLKKLLSLILILLITICSTFIVAATDAPVQQDDFFENQLQAQKTNTQLLNEIASPSLTRNDSVDYSYPDYYGGSYINDDGELVIKLKQHSKSNISSVNNIVQPNDVITEPCNYSYDELEEVIHTIRDKMMASTTSISSKEINYYDDIVTIALLDAQNVVEVSMANLNNDKIDWFKNNVLDSDAVIFANTSNVSSEEISPNYSGQGISAPGAGFSGAFRVTRYIDSGLQYGFLTCAHGNELNTTITGYYGDPIGTVQLRRYGGAFDVSYVTMSSSENFSNTISGSSYTLANTNDDIVNPTAGSYVYLNGNYTKNSGGTITSTNLGFSYNSTWFEGMTGANYASTNGDSGGLIRTSPSGNYCQAVGVHKGRFGNYKAFTSAYNVINLWYLERY